MRPYIPHGSLLDVAPALPTALEPGDVVCFIGLSGRVVAHRISRTAREEGTVLLFARGDAEGTEEPVPPETLLYAVKRVTFGRITYRTDGRVGRLLAAASLRLGNGFTALDFAIRGAARIVRFARSASRRH